MAVELTSDEIDEILEQNSEAVDHLSDGDGQALEVLFAAAGVTVTATTTV